MSRAKRLEKLEGQMTKRAFRVLCAALLCEEVDAMLEDIQGVVSPNTYTELERFIRSHLDERSGALLG